MEFQCLYSVFPLYLNRGGPNCQLWNYLIYNVKGQEKNCREYNAPSDAKSCILQKFEVLIFPVEMKLLVTLKIATL